MFRSASLNRGQALGCRISLRTLGEHGFPLRPSLLTGPFLPYPPQGSSDFCVDPDTFVTKMVEEHSVLSGGKSGHVWDRVTWDSDVERLRQPYPCRPLTSGRCSAGQEASAPGRFQVRLHLWWMLEAETPVVFVR